MGRERKSNRKDRRTIEKGTSGVNCGKKRTSSSPFIWQIMNKEQRKPTPQDDVQCPICSKSMKQSRINEHLDDNCDESFTSEDHCRLSSINHNDASKATEKSKVVIVIDDDDGGNGNQGSAIDVPDCGSYDLGRQGIDKYNELAETDCEVSLDGLVPVLESEMATVDPELLTFRGCFNPFKDALHYEIDIEEDKGEENFCSTDELFLHSKSESMDISDESNHITGTTCPNSQISDISIERCVGDDKVDKVPLPTNQNSRENELFEDGSLFAMDGGDILSETEDEPTYEPYYWANFKFVISNVISDEHNAHLFNGDDLKILDEFKLLTETAQQLYVRLFLRKYSWLQVNKLNYPKIGKDLKPVCLDLIRKGFLDDKNSLDNTQEVLCLMSAPEVRSLAQSLNLFKNEKGEKLSKKKDLINAIINLGNSQKSVISFFSPKFKHSMKNSILQKAKSFLGDSVRISHTPRDVFNRCFSLFSLANYSYNDDDNAKSTLIFRILQINKGDLVFPSYAICRTVKIFNSRSDSIKYANTVLLEEEFQNAMENKDFDLALSFYRTAKSDVDILCQKLKRPLEKSMIWSASLPIQLRRFSSEWVLVRVCIKAVEALEKKSLYHEATKLLKLLLSQVTYCLRARGSLWDRLAIDTERYLKDQNKALEYIRTALVDPWVRTGMRLNLVQRAKRICCAGKNKHLLHLLSEFEVEHLKENREVTISAPIFLDTSSSHRAIFLLNKFDRSTDDADQSYSVVEEYALSHYKENGFPNGVHAEGSSYTFIFSLIFWDLIFMHVDDVFLGPYQACPLDLYSDQFFETRKEAIDRKLQEIRNSTIEDLQNDVKASWLKHKGQVCLGCSWNIFDDLEQVMDVVLCLKVPLIAGICELLCKDYRNRCSGMPDLLVWNPSTARCKAVEVKGPGDRLSNKQIIWLNILTSLGMDAEVCHVKGVGGKKRRISKD